MKIANRIPMWLLNMAGLEVAVGVTIHMHSGSVIRFTAGHISMTADDNAVITGYSWQDAVGAPLYLDPRRIESASADPIIRAKTTKPRRIVTGRNEPDPQQDMWLPHDEPTVAAAPPAPVEEPKVVAKTPVARRRASKPAPKPMNGRKITHKKR